MWEYSRLYGNVNCKGHVARVSIETPRVCTSSKRSESPVNRTSSTDLWASQECKVFDVYYFQSKTFAEDLYPDTAGYTPALTADQFIAGENSAPAVLPFLELQAANSTSKGFSASNAVSLLVESGVFSGGCF